jgi:hypothetical protein
MPTLRVGDVLRHTTWQKELDFVVLEILPEIRKIRVKSVMGGGLFSAPWHWVLRDGMREFVLPEAEAGTERCGIPVGTLNRLCALREGHDGLCEVETESVAEVVERHERRERVLAPNVCQHPIARRLECNVQFEVGRSLKVGEWCKDCGGLFFEDRWMMPGEP